MPVDYFERLEKQREKEEKALADKAKENDDEEYEKVIEKVVVKFESSQILIHLMGMLLMTLGVFVLLRNTL